MRSLIDRLNFHVFASLPVVLQAEVNECGLACITMIANYHRDSTDLKFLRYRFPQSTRGTTLAELIHIATSLKLGTRPLKLDLVDLKKLHLPCILHWEFNHFVVLKSVSTKSAVIHDPALGARTIRWDEFSRCFTGVALELWPTAEFKRQPSVSNLALHNAIGHINGLLPSCMQVLLLAFALELVGLVAPFFLQWVIDKAIVSADQDLLKILAISFTLLLLIQQALTAMRSWVLLYLGTTLGIQWRSNVFSHLVQLPMRYFEGRHLGDIISRFSSIDVIQRTLTTSFVEAIIDGTMAGLTLILMLAYSGKLSAIAVVAMLIYALVRCVWYRPLRAANEEEISHAARQQSHLLETLRGIKAIKLFGRHEERRSNWLSYLVEQTNAGLRTAKLQLFYRLANGILFGIENILIIWLGALAVITAEFSVGALTAFIAYKGHFDLRVAALIDKLLDIKMLRIQTERLEDIVLSIPEPTVPSENDGTEAPPDISIRSLRFKYATHEPYVLDGISLEIPSGTSVAIVGPSGSGKTTLINILLGIHLLTEGEIFLDDVPLQRLGLHQLRRMVGTVLQDDCLFGGSVADNISFFDPQADITWIMHCAQLAAIDEEISAMPMGYNTLVGDMGTVMSGGQKQRILLARALYKRPKILILDEATSHLDIERECRVNEAIRQLNITRVIIAHRPETIASANRVVTLANGKIVSDCPLSAGRFVCHSIGSKSG